MQVNRANIADFVYFLAIARHPLRLTFRLARLCRNSMFGIPKSRLI
jgi:hypothetical protein